jgi:hypothetical protein
MQYNDIVTIGWHFIIVFDYFCSKALLLLCLNKAVLKKGKRHIIYTWIVLICFVAGQVMVSAHQHLVKYNTHQIAQNQQTVTEKCQLCDVMHHNSMTIAEHHYFIPLVSTDYFYTPGKYNFVSIALILSSGRAPPLS